MPLPYDLINVRDELQELADEVVIGSPYSKPELRDSERRYLASLLEAWRILDREVTRMAEEE